MSEGSHQVGDHGPVNGEMVVVDRVSWPLCNQVAFRDIHGTGETLLPVNDENFLVIAQVEIRHLPRQE